MKRSVQVLPLAALLVANAAAQSSSVISDPTDTSTRTVYYSVCPTTTSTTITLPGTTTVCPDGRCTGSNTYPIITAVPTPITVTGTDGRETIYNVETTILPALCPGGVCGATYTISEQCPCTAGPKTVTIESCPPGFTTTVVECHACAANGGPSTVTLTTPIPGGLYASQNPAMGPATNAPAAITSAAYAGTGSGPGAGRSSSAVAAVNNAGSSSGSAVNNVGSAGSSIVAAASVGTQVLNDIGSKPSGALGQAINQTVPLSPSAPIVAPYLGSASTSSWSAASVALAGIIGALALLL